MYSVYKNGELYQQNLVLEKIKEMYGISTSYISILAKETRPICINGDEYNFVKNGQVTTKEKELAYLLWHLRLYGNTITTKNPIEFVDDFKKNNLRVRITHFAKTEDSKEDWLIEKIGTYDNEQS